ncbi:hypothetical protein B5X24_HaOG207776 [Helicoverpa armigera]|nr:hypothetical protein B5X24_HaOG207776 [Helicoverpa armigera]
MKDQRSDLCSRYITIFIVVSCYWVVSIATVFVNKALLSSQAVALEAPLFITWFQCIVSFSICYTLSRSGGIPGVFAFPKGSPWKMDVMRKVKFTKDSPQNAHLSPLPMCFCWEEEVVEQTPQQQ